MKSSSILVRKLLMKKHMQDSLPLQPVKSFKTDVHMTRAFWNIVIQGAKHI